MSVKLGFIKYILKPLIAAGAMGICTWGVYKGLMMIINSNIISVVVSIMVAVVVYFIFVVLLKILNDEEIKMLPMGEKILKLLKRK